jgi:hypothetical protein
VEQAERRTVLLSPEHEGDAEALLVVLIAIAALLARSAATSAPQAVGVETLVPLLRDLPTLLLAATNAERRAVVRELVTQVYVQRSVVMALRPTKIAAALFEAAVSDHRDEWLKRVFWWAGWGSGLDPHTLVKMVPAVLRAA